MHPNSPVLNLLSLLVLILITLLPGSCAVTNRGFSIKEASVNDIQLAFKNNQLTSRQLVEFYITEIRRHNPLLRGVIEVNPDALHQADQADHERKTKAAALLPHLHGIPILLKDNIATKDRLNTTAGSFALLGSVVPRDAGVVLKLRKAGAIVLGKASMTEWAAFRSSGVFSGWCARIGRGKNPYVLSATPCGSSSGSAISVAANLGAVSLGTETDGSILCPSSLNSVVGIKPTVGLTSRAGVVPITPRQDTVGPICRSVSDAAYVLDAIAGFDYNDNATKEASKYIPNGGYKQFLNPNGLKGKRLGIVRIPFFNFSQQPEMTQAFESHFQTLRRGGAVIIDHLKIANIDEILDISESGEMMAMLIEFQPALNAYLKELVVSKVRSLADVIAFNKKFAKLEKIKEYGQDTMLRSEAVNKLSGVDKAEKAILSNLAKLSRNGFKKLMRVNKLDALVSSWTIHSVLAIGGYPGISVPAGYDKEGVPFGICFVGLRGSEPKLIEIAYGFEQATKIRKPPSFRP